MIRKLPSQVVVRWSRVVDEWSAADELEEGSELYSNNEGNDPPLKEFCKFLEKEARISGLCNPVTSLQALKTEENNLRTRLLAEEQGTPHGTKEILA